MNKPRAGRAALLQKLNLDKEDHADDLLFNDSIWKSVKGANSRVPAPVRAAFFVAVKPTRDKKDDDG